MMLKKMKPRFSIAAILLVSVFLVASVNGARWNPLNLGYTIISDPHETPLGQSVTAWAGTIVEGTTEVEFVWKAPNGSIIWDLNTTVFGPYTTPSVPDNVAQEIIDWANDNPGHDVWYANNTQFPNVLGKWGLTATFYNATKIRGHRDDGFVITHTSLHAVPEVPFGTIAILLIMFGALGVFAIKKKRLVPLGKPA